MIISAVYFLFLSSPNPMNQNNPKSKMRAVMVQMIFIFLEVCNPSFFSYISCLILRIGSYEIFPSNPLGMGVKLVWSTVFLLNFELNTGGQH
jgi:hypothetical protein